MVERPIPGEPLSPEEQAKLDRIIAELLSSPEAFSEFLDQAEQIGTGEDD